MSNNYGIIGLIVLLVGLYFGTILILYASSHPGLCIVKDPVNAYTFTDDWGNPQDEIVYSWDLHTVEIAFDKYLRERKIPVTNRSLRRVK